MFRIDPADAPARLLHDHQLLNHLFFICVEEVRELRRIERRVQLQEAAQCRDWGLSTDLGEEEGEMSLGRFDGRVLHVHRKLVAFLVWRRVGGDELGAGVQEELFESGETLLTDNDMRAYLQWCEYRTYPRDIFVNCSPYRSFTMLEMLSSTRMGDRALQIARRAYIRSAVLLICRTEVKLEPD